MNARTYIDEQEQIDPDEWDQCALFNALGLDEQGQAQLVDAWKACAPNSRLNDFTKALVIGGAKLAVECSR